MWRQIRGLGLSYSYSIYPRPNEGLLYLSFYRSTNVFAAYKEAKNIVEGQLKESAQWEETLLDSAKSSLIFEVIERERCIGDVVRQSLLSYFKNVGHDYNKKIVEEIPKVTIPDLVRVGEKYVAPLFDPSKCQISIVCHPTKAEEISVNLKELQYDVDVYLTLEESFMNEY